MKKIFYFMVMLLAFTACHTTEENYKAAYDKAMERTRQDGLYDQEQEARKRATEIVNGDSMRVIRSFFNVVDDQASTAKTYGVAIAEFDQLINARSYRERLKSKQGYESYVVYTNRDKKYVVIVQGFETKEQAANFIKHLGENKKVKVLVPRAYILQRL